MKQFDFTKDPEKKGDAAISVGNTKKRKLDLFPRILCLIVALGIWIYMVNVNDDSITETMTLKIEIVGGGNITDLESGEDMMIYDIDKTEVTVTVKGTNRDLKMFTQGEYKATVDVSSINTAGRHSIPIQIKTPANSSIALASSEFANINLTADIIAEKEIPFTAGFVEGGDSAPSDTIKLSIETSSKSIIIRGPKSIVNEISSAKYFVEYGAVTSQEYTDIVPLFQTSKGDYLSYSKTVINYSSINVKVTATTEKTLALVLKSPDSSLIASSDTKEIKVVGDPARFVDMSELVFQPPYSEGMKDVTFSIVNFLPEGITLAEGENDSINVVFEPVQPQNEE